MNINLNLKAAQVHKNNSKWWTDLNTNTRIERNKGELLMLVVSELSEAMEGERKNLMDDHLPSRKMAEVECADAVIRLLDIAGGFGYELDDAILESPMPVNKGEGLFKMVKVICQLDDALMLDRSVNNDLAVSDLINEAIDSINSYCVLNGYDLWGAYDEKCEYNLVRADHQKEARMGVNGKKW